MPDDATRPDPAPLVLTHEERQDLHGLRRFIEYRLPNLQPADGARQWLAFLNRLLAASPAQPATGSPARGAAGMRRGSPEYVAALDAELLDSERDGALDPLFAESTAQPVAPEPPPLTVGAALMLPEVRSGARHVRFMYQGVDPVALRAIAGESHIEWSDSDYDNGWEEWAPEPDELLLPCRLITPEGREP